jgi:alkanesulfonate monooxygenase SsuD/methylene tetrahydromethanopterin reductase-like flavin-dependent oxidoreductase (luciferase family)
VLDFGLYYDFRHPHRWPEILEQIAWAESIGFTSVWVSEHHFREDGYASGTMPLAAAISQRTSTMQIGTNLVVLPVHQPIRLAEDALTVDALSGGRLRLGVGLGYLDVEFTTFGQTMKQRKRRFEEGLDVLRAAFSGEPVNGSRVTPLPVDSGPEIWIGAMSQVGTERAARRGDGFLCALPQHIPVYLEARRAAGLDDGRLALTSSMVVADDPERELARIAEYVLYFTNQYVDMGTFGDIPPLTDVQQVLDLGLVGPAVDPDGAVEHLVGMIGDASPSVIDVHGWTLFPGEPIDGANARLELLANKVLPKLRKRLSG